MSEKNNQIAELEQEVKRLMTENEELKKINARVENALEKSVDEYFIIDKAFKTYAETEEMLTDYPIKPNTEVTRATLAERMKCISEFIEDIEISSDFREYVKDRKNGDTL
ncbi:hypothetical protein AGMMS49975_22150 [Clostridia bacterium]|nr:hypothetical protein AGMMS49975_22150 [Clostridia bacterium]